MLPNLSHSSSAAVEHVPVMAPEVADLLEPRPGDTIVDCTFGAGGHAAVLEPYLCGSGTYIGIDRDHEAEPFFARFAADATSQTRFVHGDFALVLRNMVASGTRVQAILMDLGVSSMQIDRPHRGFSYANDAPLDMRMDATAELTAAEIVNTWDERDLAGVLRTYGEERYSFQIARAIVPATYLALIGMLALAGALAFGLGGREIAHDMLRDAYGSARENKAQVKQDMQTGRDRAQRQAEQVHQQTQDGGGHPGARPRI